MEMQIQVVLGRRTKMSEAVPGDAFRMGKNGTGAKAIVSHFPNAISIRQNRLSKIQHFVTVYIKGLGLEVT